MYNGASATDRLMGKQLLVNLAKPSNGIQKEEWAPVLADDNIPMRFRTGEV